MGRVRLTAGGVSPSQVRLKPSGASERLRAPGDDINYAAGPGSACTVCGRQRVVPAAGRGRLCPACADDKRLVAHARATLVAAGLPPLGAAAPDGDPMRRLRARGVEAQGRLDRRQAKNRDKTAAAAPKAAAVTQGPRQRRAPRRLTAADKKAGARRLQERIRLIEQRLKHSQTLRPHARARLEEELSAARGLLRRWPDAD